MVDPKMNSDELSHLLTMSGLEVEEVEAVAPPFSNVVVAEVLEVVKHPNADRLNVCQVDVGTGTLLNIVCGAPNVRAGMKAICAMAGAVLPPGADGKPFEIKVGQLRGVESQGMMCSAKELKHLRRKQRLDGTAGRCAGRPEHPRLPGPGRPEVHDQAHAEQGGLPVGAGRGARSGGADRRPVDARADPHRSRSTATKSCR